MLDPMNIHDRLKSLGLTLPKIVPPAANYVPFVQSGTQIYIAGQLPMVDGRLLHMGPVGEVVTIEQGIDCARACALNILAVVDLAVDGDWAKLRRCIKLGGFVASTPHFTDHPKIINGASDLMVAVLGDSGKHARFAVGVSALPFGASVEIDAIFEVAM